MAAANGTSSSSGGGDGRRRFRTLGSEGQHWLRVAAFAALVLLLMMAAWSSSLSSMGAAVASAPARLSAGSLHAVAHAAEASAAWLEGQAFTTAPASAALEPAAAAGAAAAAAPVAAADPKETAPPKVEGSSPHRRSSDEGGDAKASSGDSSKAGGDAKASSGDRKFATWADELEASRGEQPDGPESEGLPCRASGYCSFGKLGEPYVGEVDSTEGYRKALAASCYKKECIHTTIGSRGHQLGLNLASSAWRLGLANFMFHAKNKEECDRLAAYGFANATCVWSERKWTPHYGDEALHEWFLRYMMVARAVWMGFHVLMLDTDSYLYQDPYLYLKRPPFANISYMSLQDGGYTVNGGAYYVHNFQPGGPVSHCIASMVDRMIRVNEAWDWIMDTHKVDNGHFGHAFQDQPSISDAVASQRLRHPTIIFTLGEKSPYMQVPDGQWKLRETGLHYFEPGVQVQYPPEWHALAGTAEAKLGGFEMNIHFLNGHWNESIGGPRFPPRANYSNFFLDVLKQESGRPYFDVEGAQPADFVPFNNETWIFTPDWLLSAYGGRGAKGFWELGPPPPQVMIHVMYVGSWWNTKEYHMKVVNAFNYDVAEAFHGGVAVPAGTKEEPLPRVLALLPGVHLDSEHSTDYRDKTARFVKLAMHLGRVALMPEPVCNSSSWAAFEPSRLRWSEPLLNPDTNKTHLKRMSDNYRVLYYGLDDNLHCHWWAHLDHDCMRGAYAINLDYQELLRRLPPGVGEPGPANTVQLGGGGGGSARRLLQQPSSSTRRRLQQQHRIESGTGGPSLQSVREAALKMKEPHVLFLSAVPDLSTPLPDGLDAAADERHKQWNETCVFMAKMPNGPWNDEGKKP